MAVGPPVEPVHIAMLGTFQVVVGGREIPEAAWPGRRSAELVQLLALAARHRLLRDQVIDALWSHLGVEAGAANLRKGAHHARQALGREDAVVLSGGGVALLPACEVQTDVDAFERLAEEALRSGTRDGCARAASAYTGVLLPGSLYEEWTLARRDRLRSLHIELLRRSEDWARLADAEPCDEQAHRELMRAALADGNRHAAIRWYGRLRTSLERELGMPPSAETQGVYEECVADLGRAATTLVGRDVELATAAAALRAAEACEVGALLVRGPPGIGKSALCRRIAVSATDGGWLAVTVAATAGSDPYAPLVSAIEQLVARNPAALETLSDTARSVLAELTSLARGDPRETGLTRHMVIGAVRRLLAACSGARGILFVVDDAHLADDATAEACTQLARAGSGPLQVVLAYRPDAARSALTRGAAALERAGRSVVIDVGPLAVDDVLALASAGARARPDDAALGRIATLAQGNPFFVLALANSSVAGTSGALPTSVRDAIAARFLDLDDAVAERLRRLAVAGDDLDPVSIPALAGLSEREAFAVLDAALAAGAVTVCGGRYRFEHDLIRQALLGQIPPHQRITMHRDAARRLAAAGAAPGLIARQWLDGGRPQEAVGWLVIAARRAVRLGAFADALAHLDAVLEHAPRHGEALCRRAEVLDALGDLRAPAAYAAAAQQAGEPASHDLRAKQALAELKLGDPPRALDTLAGAEPVSVEGRLAQALTLSGAAALGFADPELGTAKAAESRRLALASGDTGSLVVASWAQAAAAHARGDLRASVRADLRETQALPELAVSVFDGQLCITQRLLYGARPYPDVIAFADSLASEARRLGAARGHAFAVTLRGEANLLSGRLDDADDDLTLAARLNRAIGAAVGEALALQRRAEVSLHRGRTADAVALLDDALAVARESDVGFHLLDRIYGTRIAAAHDPASALAVLEESEEAVRGPLETCPGCRITLAVPAAIAAARAGDRDRAARYEQAAEMLATVVMRLPAWDAALEEVRGHRLLATGDAIGAADRFSAAAEGFHGAGHPLDAARCAQLAGISA